MSFMKNFYVILLCIGAVSLSACGTSDSSIPGESEPTAVEGASLQEGWIVEYDENGNEVWREGVFANGTDKDALALLEAYENGSVDETRLKSQTESKTKDGKYYKDVDGNIVGCGGSGSDCKYRPGENSVSVGTAF